MTQSTSLNRWLTCVFESSWPLKDAGCGNFWSHWPPSHPFFVLLYLCRTRTRLLVWAIKNRLTLSSLQRGKHRKSIILYAILSDKIVVASRAGDPLIHYGRHFGRTVHAMCNVQVLLAQGVDRLASTEVVAEESLTLEYISVILVSIISGLMACLSQTQGQEGVSSLW